MTVISYIPEAFTYTLSWSTEVMKMENGLERRLPRRHSPRELVRVTYLLTEDAEDFLRNLRRLFFLEPDATFEIPFRHERVVPAGNVTSTSVVIAQAKTLDWAVAGRRVYVERDDDEAGYGATINAVSAPSGGNVTLTLSASPPATYEAARTRVCPLIEVQPDRPELGRYRVTGGGWTLSGHVINPAYPQGQGASPTDYDGVDVLDRRPPRQEADQVNEDFDPGLTVVDEGGVIAVSTLYELSDARRSIDMSVGLEADASLAVSDWIWWKAFLWRRLGRLVEFYMPSWRADLELVEQPDPAPTLVVYDDPDYRPWFAADSHKRLALELENGSLELVEVTSVDDNLNGTLTLNLAASLSGNPVSQVCFLELVRLDADDVRLELGATKLDFAVPVVVVQQ